MNSDTICLVVYIAIGTLILVIRAWNSDFDSDATGPVGLVLFVICWPLILAIIIMLSPIWIPGALAVGISRLSKKVQAERQRREDPLMGCFVILEEMDAECRKELERHLVKTTPQAPDKQAPLETCRS